jgi:hypothetical protein
MSLSTIINVQITRETKTPTQKGFGTLLIVGDSDRFGGTERVRTYTSIEAVEADFTSGDPEIDLARAAFGQDIKPEKIKIGTLKTADSGSYPTALNAIVDADDDWYGIAIEAETEAAINAVAAWAEARIKLFFALTRDAGVPAATAGNVADDLNTAAYDRTALFYSGAVATQKLQAAIAGGQLPKTPGSITYKFKQAKGVASDKLTATQINNIENEKCNHYTSVAGINILQQGTVASGEFIDIIIGADWLTARLQETIYQQLVNLDKVPYTNQGIDLIANLMRQVLQQAVNNQFLASFTITTPDVSTISALDKGNRFLPDMEFEGVLAGAVHKVAIKGRLVL